MKRDCPTCVLVAPVLVALGRQPTPLTVYTQDDPAFPEAVDPVDDTDLAVSWHHDIETVPTLLRVEGGVEVDRAVGWSRADWQRLTTVDDLGGDLPEQRPGCGSLSVDPTLADALLVRFGGSVLASRRIGLAALEDEFEAAYDRGWSDGLPVIPPTEARVMRMLEGTGRDPGDIVATVPPDLNEVTVEQVAINAVMAGCRPEYLPVVLAALEAACTDDLQHARAVVPPPTAGRPRAHRGQRPDPLTRIGMNAAHERSRAGQPGQQHDRQGPPAGHRGTCRRWTARCGIDHGDLHGQPGEGRLLLPRGRGARLAVRAFLRYVDQRLRPPGTRRTVTVVRRSRGQPHIVFDQLSRTA